MFAMLIWKCSSLLYVSSALQAAWFTHTWLLLKNIAASRVKVLESWTQRGRQLCDIHWRTSLLWHSVCMSPPLLLFPLFRVCVCARYRHCWVTCPLLSAWITAIQRNGRHTHLLILPDTLEDMNCLHKQIHLVTVVGPLFLLSVKNNTGEWFLDMCFSLSSQAFILFFLLLHEINILNRFYYFLFVWTCHCYLKGRHCAVSCWDCHVCGNQSPKGLNSFSVTSTWKNPSSPDQLEFEFVTSVCLCKYVNKNVLDNLFWD